jgi:chromatin segregation and condensation protein Rec8/ScpA/Scc1 (kleisin family)
LENNYKKLSVPTTSLVYTTMLAAMKLRIALPTKKKRQERERDSNKRDRGTVKEPKTLKLN